MNAPLEYRSLGSADTARRLLVLLHGVGGNETNVLPLGKSFADDTLVVLPRAPLTLAPGQYAWFPVAFGPDGPRIDFDQAQRSARALQDFLRYLQGKHGIAPKHTVIAGFSQGGIMSASVALTTPELVGGFAVLAGRILPEIEPLAAPANALRNLDALVLHGRNDEKLPVTWAERADALLGRLGVPHRTVLHDGGHSVPPDAQKALVQWHTWPVAHWNATEA